MRRDVHVSGPLDYVSDDFRVWPPPSVETGGVDKDKAVALLHSESFAERGRIEHTVLSSCCAWVKRLALSHLRWWQMIG